MGYLVKLLVGRMLLDSSCCLGGGGLGWGVGGGAHGGGGGGCGWGGGEGSGGAMVWAALLHSCVLLVSHKNLLHADNLLMPTLPVDALC